LTLDKRGDAGVICFHRPVAIGRHSPRRPEVLVGMLRSRRPQGTAGSTLTGTVGWSRSRFEESRDGLRPLEATAPNATRARLRFDKSSAALTRTSEGPGKQHREALRAISSSREVAPGWRVTRARDHLQRACGP
jgi:hypothetical protein